MIADAYHAGINASEKASETWGGKDFGRMKAAQRMAESQKRQQP
jgi:hypothetical protein